jgi:hypothetical protein
LSGQYGAAHADVLAFCPFSALSPTPQVLTLMKEIKDTLNKGQE